MHKFWLIIVLLTVAPCLVAAQAVCGDREKFLKHLKKTHKEEPRSIGVANNGQILEVLRSKKGTWSVLMTSANGVTCLVATGDAWEDVPSKAGQRT